MRSMLKLIRFRWLASIVLVVVPSADRVARAAPDPQRETRETLGASLNLPGLQNTLETSWRWDGAALGVGHVLSPSFTRINLWAEWVPTRPIAVRVGIEPTAYFGRSGALVSYDSYDADFSKDSRDAREDEQAGFGGRAYASPSLRLRAGRFVATSTADFEWWRTDATGPLYYEPARDTLLEAGGDRLWTLTTVVLFETEGAQGQKLAVGANHRRLRVFDAPENDAQRLGGVIIWTLGERRFGVRQPTVLANGGVYLEDRFKEGEVFVTVAVRFLLGR